MRNPHAYAALLSLALGCSSGASEDLTPKYKCAVSDSDCYCGVYVHGDPPTEPQKECSAAAFPGTTCCADDGWPGTGQPSLVCYCTQSNNRGCDLHQHKIDSCKYSAPSTTPPAGTSCNLAADRWYSECSAGCGDVMTCQSFCSGCTARCYVACTDDADCQRVGAGSCQTSAKGTNRCSTAPSKCP